MDSRSTYRFFIAVSPGLEALLQEELAELGMDARATPGGAEVTGTLAGLWQLHSASRLAENVRLRLKPFHAASFAELERGLARLPWHAFLRRDLELDISVTCHKSRLYHTGAIAERVQRGVEARLGVFSPSAEAPQRLFVRLERDQVQVSVDASGDRLHKRGYRQHVGEAPLRETLAAALCRLLKRESTVRKRPSAVVWDPFCGSGTLLIEWLALEAGLLPGAGRRFAFERWPIHAADAYAEFCRLHQGAVDLGSRRVIGSDRSDRAIAAARHNAELAGLSDACTFVTADFREVAAQVPPGAHVLANPPYGVRLEAGRSRKLLTELDRLLQDRPDLRPALVVSPDRQYFERSKLGWTAAARFKSGGIDVTAWLL